MFRFGLFLVVIATTYGEDIKVSNDKWENVISNGMWDSRRWTLRADSGSTIRLVCPEFEVPFPETMQEIYSCQDSTVTFDDGTGKHTWCGYQYDFELLGHSSELTIDLTVPEGSQGKLECWAKAGGPPKSPELVTIDVSDGVKEYKFPDTTGQDSDKALRFKAAGGNQISLQCRFQMAFDQDEECIKEIVTVDSGDGPKYLCGEDELNETSRNEELTLRVETYPSRESHVVCKVQSISG